MNCEKYKTLIEKYLDGIITNGELEELREHTEACLSCRAEFEHTSFVEDAVKQAFSSHTAAEQAGTLLIDKLSAGLDRKRLVRHSAVFFANKRAAVAASILLGAGLLLGFTLGRAGKPSGEPLRSEVSIHVGHVEGTVLVRHEGSDMWRAMETGSKVRLGDTFHSAVKSTCILELGPKSTLGLNQNSMLILESFNGKTQFRLEHGELDATLESPHPPFFISTPHGRVEALGTEFTVTVIDE